MLPKTRVLLFFPHNPYPPQSGAHKRCLSVIDGLLRKGWEVHLFSSMLFTDHPWSRQSLQWLKEKSIHPYIYQGTKRDAAFIRERRLSGSSTAYWESYTPPDFARAFQDIYRAVMPDYVWINYSLWGNLTAYCHFMNHSSVVDMHDLITLNFQMSRALKQCFAAAYQGDELAQSSLVDIDYFRKLNLQADEMEYQVFNRFDYTMAISQYEAGLVRSRCDKTRVLYQPMIMDPCYCANQYSEPPVFVAGANNIFNTQGYYITLKGILPYLQNQVPAMNLQVVGAGTGQLPAHPQIVRQGFVKELASVYQLSCYAICPVVGGTGQQVKVMEAMAHGLPVVIFEHIAHSSPVQHGVNGFIAKNEKEFAEYMQLLYSDRSLCKKMGHEARNFVANNFSVKTFEEQLTKMETSLI